MKNLVVGVVGDKSLHNVWLEGEMDYDLFLVYYGDDGEKYKNDGKFYAQEKGTKFVILSKVVQKHPDIFEQYDAIFVPDDDLYFTVADCNRFFKLFHSYDLDIAQPSLIGYVSLPITANVTFSSIRYTNWVEIMTPCFSQAAFQKCLPTFTENVTNWGIECLWNHFLGKPTNKIAIIDDVIVAHTRPCFYGDTYHNNGTNFQIAWKENEDLLKKYSLDNEKIVYQMIPKSLSDFNDRGSEDKIYPDVDFMKDLIKSLRQGK